MQVSIETTHFNEYPIEFKEINPEDFEYIFNPNGERIERGDFKIENNGEKIIISTDEEGYINTEFQRHIDLEHKNTIVVNAAVGQGKSYAIIQTIKRYYDADEKYLIFVASPFVSLVKQYCNDIEDAGIPKEQIYNYGNLGRNNGINYLARSIQVITANTLLGNPGEDGFKNSDIKREYINNLVAHCERNGIKVVFIYDELHDSFHNFKQEYIFNLWKWKNVIHKNFVLSATYNEASKVVIEYLAELTDFQIKIIESERVRFPEKQSSLHLHYSSAYNFTINTPEINQLIKELIDRNKNIDILCYSKTLAKSILNPREELGKLLREKFGEIKDCTSELITNQRAENEEPKNQYDNTKCNVGTNFKTGVSIKKENHAYVIIMPPRATRLWFKNQYGIFSGGINSVIQAIARQRNKGEIHIVLSKPDRFNYDSLSYSEMSNSQKEQFKEYYDFVNYHKEPKKLVSYIKLNRQDFFMREFYENKLKANVQREIDLLNSDFRNYDLPNLAFPTYDEFKLENGEDYLANEFPIFGEDISAYVTYASITNQFVNCCLQEIRVKPTIGFNEGQLQDELIFIYDLYFGEDHYNSLRPYSNFPLFYHDIRNSLFSDYQLKLKRIGTDEYNNITSNSIEAKIFDNQLLYFSFQLWQNRKPDFSTDIEYTRSEYFLDCISNSLEVNLETIENEPYQNKALFYQLLNGFREKLISNLQEYQRGSSHYFCIPKLCWDGFFSAEDRKNFRKLLRLIDSDPLVSNGVFEFKRRLDKKTDFQEKLKIFYRILIEDFFVKESRDIAPKITFPGIAGRRNVEVVSAIKTIPHRSSTIDTISLQDYKNL